MRNYVILALIVALAGCNKPSDEESMEVEEFRVAEPLADTESALRKQLETITAVTEPYDEVEASVEDDTEPIARTQPDLETQCVTVLKEMAYCTNEDAFLDIIGDSTSLTNDETRERFMTRVQHWFEPGGVRVDCRVLMDEEESQQTDARLMWQRVSSATEGMCADFGSELIDADAFRWMNELWKG